MPGTPGQYIRRVGQLFYGVRPEIRQVNRVYTRSVYTGFVCVRVVSCAVFIHEIHKEKFWSNITGIYSIHKLHTSDVNESLSN